MARNGDVDSSPGDVGGSVDRGGGADGWDPHLTHSRTRGHDGHRAGLMPRDEPGRHGAPRHRAQDGRELLTHFAIATRVPERRSWVRRKFVMVLVGGTVAAIVLTAAVLVMDRGGGGAGRDAIRAPAPTAGRSAGTPALLPRSAGTPRTELPPPAAAPPAPTAEQMTPPPVAAPRWPRHDAPTRRTPSPPISSPPSMSFAPKPVTPPATATPGRNGHHGFF
jgi:hypothetical protein